MASRRAGLKLSGEMQRGLKLGGPLLLVLALGLVLALFVTGGRQASRPRAGESGVISPVVTLPLDRRARRGGLDVTFLVTADTHFGFGASETDALGQPRDAVSDPQGTDVVNARQVAAMNGIPGRSWPSALGGSVGMPRGVLIAGDLTENGDAWQWRSFLRYFGRSGGDALLRYPVFEGHGNHDKHHSWYVLDRVRERHGGWRYAFDWDDLHLVCLGEAPDDQDLEWLAADLNAVGRARPVVVYLHLPLLGPFSEGNEFARGGHREKLARVLAPYNVVALFHGHYHASLRYRWQGLDVYNVGAARHEWHSFAVVHLNDERLQVASYQYDLERWEWWHRKPINGTPGEVVSGGDPPELGALPAYSER